MSTGAPGQLQATALRNSEPGSVSSESREADQRRRKAPGPSSFPPRGRRRSQRGRRDDRTPAERRTAARRNSLSGTSRERALNEIVLRPSLDWLRIERHDRRRISLQFVQSDRPNRYVKLNRSQWHRRILDCCSRPSRRSPDWGRDSTRRAACGAKSGFSGKVDPVCVKSHGFGRPAWGNLAVVCRERSASSILPGPSEL